MEQLKRPKPDVTGLYALQYMMDHAAEMGLTKLVSPERQASGNFYTTYLASSFRTLRFGLNEAHGKGMAVQFNFYLDKGGFVDNGDGTFGVDVPKMKQAVAELDHDLLTLEAQGDYAGAKKLLDELGVIRPSLRKHSTI